MMTFQMFSYLIPIVMIVAVGDKSFKINDDEELNGFLSKEIQKKIELTLMLFHRKIIIIQTIIVVAL